MRKKLKERASYQIIVKVDSVRLSEKLEIHYRGFCPGPSFICSRPNYGAFPSPELHKRISGLTCG